MHRFGKRNLIRTIIFLIIIFMIAMYLNAVFTMERTEESKETFNTFYSEIENTIDGVYFGASSSNRYWIAPLAFEEYGMAISSMATTSQPLVLTKYLMEEAEKTQNPKLFIVELRGAIKSSEWIQDPYIRKVTDSMKPSLTRIRAINESLEFASIAGNEMDSKIDYYFPLLKYHSRWNNEEYQLESELKLEEPISYSKGFFLTPSKSFQQIPQSAAQYTEEEGGMAPELEDVIIDLLDYCDSIDTEVLFVMSPHSAKKDNLKILNQAKTIVESRGYTVLDFNTEEMIEAVGIDWELDFYNENHTNCVGAEKYTYYLANYISEHYVIEDHRGDSQYKSWDEAYKYYEDYTTEKKQTKMVTSESE